MEQIKPHMMEYAAESVFMYTTYSRGGCRHAPYTPICASGPNGSTLHYGHAASPNGLSPLLLQLVSCTLLTPHAAVKCHTRGHCPRQNRTYDMKRVLVVT